MITATLVVTVFALSYGVASAMSGEYSVQYDAAQRTEAAHVRTQEAQERAARKTQRVEERIKKVDERARLRAERVEERMKLHAEKREERAQLRREAHKAAAQRRAKRFEERYAHASQKLKNVLARLKAAGVDTTKITPLLGTLNTKAKAVAAAFKAFEDAQDGDDAAARVEARKNLIAARNDFRTYYRTTVRPTVIEAIKEAIRAKATARQAQ